MLKYVSLSPASMSALAALKGALTQLKETFTNSFRSYVRTPNIVRATGAGTIADRVYSFSIYNGGAADGTVLGVTIKPEETLNFSAGAINNYYAANTITYDGTGTELLIIYNT